jgi:hypothetical protein
MSGVIADQRGVRNSQIRAQVSSDVATTAADQAAT